MRAPRSAPPTLLRSVLLAPETKPLLPFAALQSVAESESASQAEARAFPRRLSRRRKGGSAGRTPPSHPPQRGATKQGARFRQRPGLTGRRRPADFGRRRLADSRADGPPSLDGVRDGSAPSGRGCAASPPPPPPPRREPPRAPRGRRREGHERELERGGVGGGLAGDETGGRRRTGGRADGPRAELSALTQSESIALSRRRSRGVGDEAPAHGQGVGPDAAVRPLTAEHCVHAPSCTKPVLRPCPVPHRRGGRWRQGIDSRVLRQAPTQSRATAAG